MTNAPARVRPQLDAFLPAANRGSSDPACARTLVGLRAERALAGSPPFRIRLRDLTRIAKSPVIGRRVTTCMVNAASRPLPS